MSIWDRFLYLKGLRPTPGPRTYYFDASESLRVTLSTLATDEGCPEDELTPNILVAGLTQYEAKERLWNTWETLSAREKDVVAFVCLGYTNQFHFHYVYVYCKSARMWIRLSVNRKDSRSSTDAPNIVFHIHLCVFC